MGALGTILDIAGIGAKIADNPEEVNALFKNLRNTQSISERARKNIFIYPVLFSQGMNDLDIDMTVTKYLEIQYGIFTLMTVGLNPSVANGDLDNYLNSIAAESWDNLEWKMYNVRPEQKEVWYNLFSEENKDFFKEYDYSLEDSTDAGKKIDKLYSLDVDSNIYKEDVDTVTLGNTKNLETQLGKSAPTIITLKLKIKGYSQDFNVPVALKANPHFLRSEDLGALMDSAIEDTRLKTRIVKLTSGEISFFKDFVFQMDRIKRDQQLYKAFGTHPWYQQFMNRKSKRNMKRAGIIAEYFLNNGGTAVGSNFSNYLPTASLIMTVDEFEEAAKLKYGYILKNNEKIIWKILSKLGLLCIGIYRPEVDLFTFFFSGFKKPLVIRTKDMKASDKKNSTDAMVDLMNNLLKRGVL